MGCRREKGLSWDNFCRVFTGIRGGSIWGIWFVDSDTDLDGINEIYGK